jgi:hypothetical protein
MDTLLPAPAALRRTCLRAFRREQQGHPRGQRETNTSDYTSGDINDTEPKPPSLKSTLCPNVDAFFAKVLEQYIYVNSRCLTIRSRCVRISVPDEHRFALNHKCPQRSLSTVGNRYYDKNNQSKQSQDAQNDL